MPQQQTLQSPFQGSASASTDAAPGLPASVTARFNGELGGQEVLSWSEYDLDDRNQFAQQYLILTPQQLLYVDATGRHTIELATIGEAKIVEGLGVDRLRIISGGRLAVDFRYSRSTRATMTRLNRRLQRCLTKTAAGTEERPTWLDAVERETEKREICRKCGERIPSYAEGFCPRCAAQRKILWRLLDAAKPYKWTTRLALLLTIVSSVIVVVPSVISRYMIDRAMLPTHPGMTIHERVSNLMLLTLAYAVMVIIIQFLSGQKTRVLAILGERVTADIRHQVYAHMHELSLRYFSKRRTGSLITRVTSDTDRLWDFIVFGSVDFMANSITIVVILSVMFFTNWHLALVAMLPLPFLTYLTYHRGMRMQALHGRLWTYYARMNAVVGDAIPGVRVVKAFANEKKEVDRFDVRSEEYTEKSQDIHKIWTTLQPMVQGLMSISTLIVLCAGGYLIIIHSGTSTADKNSYGVLMMFVSLVNQFYSPLQQLANSNRMVTRAATSAQRIFEVLDTPPDIYSGPEAIRKEELQGRIEFRNVSFSYEGAQPALRDVSMLAEPGEMIGLCGPSGAGKSTFVNLICRFYDATEGQILIDGIDIREYDVKFLRRQIGMVLQEPYLFHGTVADNIRYGNADASDAEVITAARAANAHDFIVGFPDGYDTMVGERGQSLSGGERQRISIARAILHNPRILILDEATSSVDTETERQIQQALDRLVQGRTTFAIAHRLSTLTAADRLVVLENGKIVEQGVHSQLVDKPGGVYAKLHQTQVEMNSQVAVR